MAAGSDKLDEMDDQGGIAMMQEVKRRAEQKMCHLLFMLHEAKTIFDGQSHVLKGTGIGTGTVGTRASTILS